MTKKINFIILGINVYANYDKVDVAGSMRVKNIFDPLLQNKDVSASNLILLDLLGMHHNGFKESTTSDVDCLSIGYRSIINPFSVIGYLKRGIDFIKKHNIENANNIIYNYQYPDIRNFLLLLYAKFKGFKIVFDIVEDKNHYEVKTWNDRVNKKLSLFFLRLIPRYADAVFVISSHLEKQITKIAKNRIPVFLLPISVDFKNIDKPYLKVNENNTIKIFYGGSFDPKDGLEFLWEAIEIIRKNNYNFKLILSGRADFDDMNSIFSKIKNSHLVDYKGFLSTEEYFKLLNSVDICCMTRNNSAFANAGFPFKLGEFLAAGKLIIASRIGDVEKYLVHKESAYLITPESTAEIVEGLTYYMENLATLSKKMGAQARLVAEKNFDASVSSKFMLEKCISIFTNKD